MRVTAELHIDENGYTWQFFDTEHIQIAEYTMKRQGPGHFKSTVKGSVEDVLRQAAEKRPDLHLEPLIEKFEEEYEPAPDEISTALRYISGY